MWMALWVLFVIWMLHLAVPNAEMRRDRAGNGAYYLVWAFVFSCLLAIQYTMMAHAGHAQRAVYSDGIALGLFLLGYVGNRYLKRYLVERTSSRQGKCQVGTIPSKWGC